MLPAGVMLLPFCIDVSICYDASICYDVSLKTMHAPQPECRRHKGATDSGFGVRLEVCESQRMKGDDCVHEKVVKYNE